MSTAKQIPALTAEDGGRVTTWDSMAVNFFQEILGENEPPLNLPPTMDVNDPILEVIQDQLTAYEKKLWDT